MKNEPPADRVLRKLERLMNRSLNDLTPRTLRGLGTDGLEDTLSNGIDSTTDDIAKRERLGGRSLRETKPRLRRELGV
ncbi:MAG: hypothetical protein ACC645_10285 [Pirellulales bacterium]